MDMKRYVNFNLGLLGHVDSGKTSLAKKLSTVASTAAFDKNPQSQERGITLDLGFSCIKTEIPNELKSTPPPENCAQFNIAHCDSVSITLVDCPGHASLIRTVIGGAQIIDMIILVVDITKGIQTQTAECLIIASILKKPILVILNKIDLIPESELSSKISKMKQGLGKTLTSIGFTSVTIVAYSCLNEYASDGDIQNTPGLVALLMKEMVHAFDRRKNEDQPFLFAVDHCFSVKGAGTIITGTVLKGQVKIGDEIELAHGKGFHKVRSIQVFKQPVSKLLQGHRAGICLAQLDASIMERGLAFSPGSIKRIYAFIAAVNVVSFYKSLIASKSKFHVSVGYDTSLGVVTFFKSENYQQDVFDVKNNYEYLEEIPPQSAPATDRIWALVELECPVVCPKDSMFIASKLDVDPKKKQCRLAFHGNLTFVLTDASYRENWLPGLNVYKARIKKGHVDRVMDNFSIIGEGLAKNTAALSHLIGSKVELATGTFFLYKNGKVCSRGLGEVGTIEGSFGAKGKFRVRFHQGLNEEFLKAENTKQKGKKGHVKVELTLYERKYIFRNK